MLTTAVFYKRAYDFASEEEKAQIKPYLDAAMALTSRDPLPPKKDSKETERQRRKAEKTIRIMIKQLSETAEIEEISSLDNMEFRIKQEICYAGWCLWENGGKPVISAHLPTRHVQLALF